MICAYCNKDKKSTKEHIIPKGIIDLFPECDLAYNGFDKSYKGEATIKDVCSECNNGNLSYLDTYGKKFVEKYFMTTYKTDDNVEIEYEYKILIRWLLKILYNSERSYKSDISWFKKNIEYILNDKDLVCGNVSLFGGLAINTSCMPEFFVENRQVNIIINPMVLINGVLEQKLTVDENEQIKNTYSVNKNPDQFNIDGLFNKYIIRVGSAMFFILLWNGDVEESYISNIEKCIEYMYPYNLYESEEAKIKLERCTHSYNYHQPLYIDSYMGMETVDFTNCFVGQDIKAEDIAKELSVDWNKYVKKTREEFKENKKKDSEMKKKKKKKKNQEKASKKINRN